MEFNRCRCAPDHEDPAHRGETGTGSRSLKAFDTFTRLSGAEMLERILAPMVAVVEAIADAPEATLYPAEQAAVARAVLGRHTEFATARVCARAALARLGEVPAASRTATATGRPR